MDELDYYLSATRLCDFDRDPAIPAKATELTQGCTDNQERFEQIYHFVKELPYGLEDWDVKASETLRKGWGMCCGKTNLLVALSRVLLIPARYKVFKIKAEQRLLEWVAGQNKELAIQLGDLPREQDHLECEVYLKGWKAYDPARDSPFEKGLKKLGIPLEREPVTGSIILASIDEWAENRQKNRRFREQRQALFARVNEQLNKIRLLGKGL
jgi:transglutaminase-like putative cysteine protease